VPILSNSAVATWAVAGVATACVIIRPWRIPEAAWAVLGAVALVGLGLLPWTDALLGVRKGLDVYLFLTGMMLLAELARQEGLFDWLAALAVEHARGSPQRLFTLVYIVGTVVTVLLSIGIGGSLAAPPLPHHRAYGSVRGGSRSCANTRRTRMGDRAI
jgi:arsenical pump membrane protein